MYLNEITKKLILGLLLATPLALSINHTHTAYTTIQSNTLSNDYIEVPSPLPPESTDSFQVIAHALGQVDGRTLTNSKEAFLQSAHSGYTLLEADFQHTSDGVLVVRHDFLQDSYYVLEQPVVGDTSMTIDAYTSQRINFKYTPLTAKDLLELMDIHPHIRIITDTKNTQKEQIEKDFTSLITLANSMDKPYLLDRFIIQLYNKEMYPIVNNLYPFKAYILTTYQLPPGTEADLAAFCASNGIQTLTVPASRLNKEMIDIIKSYGINLYTHTLNRLMDIRHFKSMGVDGVYTDLITPHDLSYIMP